MRDVCKRSQNEISLSHVVDCLFYAKCFILLFAETYHAVLDRPKQN